MTSILKLSSLAALLAIAATGCDVGGTNPGSPDAPTGLPDSAPPTGNIIAGNETWTGTKVLTDDVTITATGHLTVMPGTIITGPMGKNIRVQGKLTANGTAASRIKLGATTNSFGGIVVETGGTATVSYLDAEKVATVIFAHAGATATLDHADIKMVGSAIWVNGGNVTMTRSTVFDMTGAGVNLISGSATVRDSKLTKASGDIIVANGGSITVEYSEIGAGAPVYEHCDLHFAGDVVIKVTHNNIRSSVYGLMFYGGTNADFTFNNWFDNETDLDPATGNELQGRTGNFANSYWSKPPGALAGATFMPMSPTMLTDAGVRPE